MVRYWFSLRLVPCLSVLLFETIHENTARNRQKVESGVDSPDSNDKKGPRQVEVFPTRATNMQLLL